MHRCEFCNLLHISAFEYIILQRFAEAMGVLISDRKVEGSIWLPLKNWRQG
jgi:hypothetical protein